MCNEKKTPVQFQIRWTKQIDGIVFDKNASSQVMKLDPKWTFYTFIKNHSPILLVLKRFCISCDSRCKSIHLMFYYDFIWLLVFVVIQHSYSIHYANKVWLAYVERWQQSANKLYKMSTCKTIFGKYPEKTTKRKYFESFSNRGRLFWFKREIKTIHEKVLFTYV